MKSNLLVFPLFALVLSCHSKSDDIQPQQLAVAAFDSPATIDQYTAMALQNKSLNATTYSWDFGDGFKSSEPVPSHSYVKSGTYAIKLKVLGTGKADSITRNITVRPYSVFNHASIKFAGTYKCKVVSERYPVYGPGTRTALPDQVVTFTQQGENALLWGKTPLAYVPENAASPQLPPVRPYYNFFYHGIVGSVLNGYSEAAFYQTGDSVRFSQVTYIGHSREHTIYYGVRQR